MSALSPEAERRLQNIQNLGTVKEINGGKVRVQIGDNLTDWIPFASGRSGGVKIWNPPSIGEQVQVTSPTGELESAYASGSIPSAENPNPSDNLNAPAIHMPDSAVFSYDHKNHVLTFSLPANSQINIVGKDITLNVHDANIHSENCTFTGENHTVNATDINFNGIVTINGKPYLGHTHLNVKSGPDQSGGVAP